MIDRKGNVTPLKVPDGPYLTPRVSPNGKQVAYGSDDGKDAIVWIYDWFLGNGAIRPKPVVAMREPS